MNKNLKKVISAVAAIAMSASTFTALAATFPDVPEDASYAQAVQELSALDVVSGTDQGTFEPDKLVTRAEITKMIVDALNERSMAEASKASSQFEDVNAAGNGSGHWARGYINQGVADKFIAGYGDGNFGPDDNVTYVQAQKMLISAIGYETYAVGNGGWPNGYKMWASSQGITAGISGIADDAELTRAQVAQLVDNAMGAPTCTQNGFTNTLTGRVPNLQINDGEGKEFQTLFTMKHNAYKVYGRVTETNRTNSSIPVDKVNFRVEKADNFDDQWIGTARNADETEITEEMYFGDTNAVGALLTYSEALIQMDDDDEYHILSISPAAASKSVTLAAEDFDSDKTASENDGNITKLYFFPAGSNRNSTKYSVADDAVIYLNGVESDYDMDDLVDFIEKNDTAAVTLEKQTNQGSTSTTTDYNLIRITSYDTAVVKSVSSRNDQVTVNFEDQSLRNARLIFYLDDEDRSYSVTYEGEEISPADLQENDVLSIAWDNQSTNVSDSSFIDVIVSRDVVDGARCSSINESDGEYTFGGSDIYKKASNMNKVDLEMSATYVLYLDHFGRIAKADEDSVSKKIGILKNVYKKAGGDYYAQIITKEGTEEEYKVDTDKRAEYQGYLKGEKDTNGEAIYDDNNLKSELYPQQVIEYSVSSSSNKLTIKGAALKGQHADAEYRASSEKIGTVKLSDASVIMDISDIDVKDDYTLVSPQGLTDGMEYEAYGYDESNSGSTYHRFILITNGTASYNYDSQLAVIKKVNEVSDDDSTKVGYDLVVNGEDASYVVDDDVALDGGDGFREASDLVAGDVILFTTNAAGYINKVKLVFDEPGKLSGKYTSFRDALLGNKPTLIDKPENNGTNWLGFFNGKDSEDVDIVWGVAAGSKGNNVIISEPGTISFAAEDGDGNSVKGHKAINLDNADDEFNYANAVIYTYNFGASTSRGNSRVSLDDGFIETPSNSAVEYDDEEGNTWMDLEDDQVIDDIVFAVARIDGSDVLELYLIYND